MRVFSLLYGVVVRNLDKRVPALLRPFWTSPTGPQTVFFWGPVVKWCVVLAGLGDLLNRQPHLISKKQTLVLALSGVLWSRWSMVIRPRNYNYMACNAVMSASQTLQLWRSISNDLGKVWQDLSSARGV
ncbi:mitochondrial pyruvate carrier 4 isoform X1 [Drosophila obscura]|uniref:mitochondrial pyruvate carrier 4 isoform X1 n=1 Tax=Drosophila obscura TaxID=7282 RepID=UPI001BB142AC|nr:mitochondrial pyruvate carrier 4 isoform X1 [Drosophila obscura]